jgi:hypothetical protein
MKEDKMQLGANGYFASKLNKMDPLIAWKHVSSQKVTQILGVDFEYTFFLVVKMTSLWMLLTFVAHYG